MNTIGNRSTYIDNMNGGRSMFPQIFAQKELIAPQKETHHFDHDISNKQAQAKILKQSMIDQLSATNERQNDTCTVEIKQLDSGQSPKRQQESRPGEDSTIMKTKYQKIKENEESQISQLNQSKRSNSEPRLA